MERLGDEGEMVVFLMGLMEQVKTTVTRMRQEARQRARGVMGVYSVTMMMIWAWEVVR
jgi:hypothetical protein